MAAKIRNRQEEVLEEDTTAAEDQAAFSSTRADILENCQLTHPIVYDSFNLCALYACNGFKKLSVNMLSVSRATFHFILGRAGNVLQRQTVTEEPISPEERLGICLYTLGRGDYYYTIAEMLGRGVASVSSIVLEVCQVFVEYLWPERISSKMPKTSSERSSIWRNYENSLAAGWHWMGATYP